MIKMAATPEIDLLRSEVRKEYFVGLVQERGTSQFTIIFWIENERDHNAYRCMGSSILDWLKPSREVNTQYFYVRIPDEHGIKSTFIMRPKQDISQIEICNMSTPNYDPYGKSLILSDKTLHRGFISVNKKTTMSLSLCT